MLKGERQRRILELVQTEGRVVATELEHVFGVSGYTVRRDLDELADRHSLQRVHGGALARSQVPTNYDDRQQQGLPGKAATARAAATLLEPGQVVIVDGGSTALRLVEEIPERQPGTFVTHSPEIARALGGRGLDVVVVGGSLDPNTMVAVGAETIAAYERIAADICFLGIWAVNAERGITGRYPEEADVRRTLLNSADRIVGLASLPKLGTLAPFGSGPASALTHLATEPDVPADLLQPFRELGLHVLQDDAPG